MGNTFTGFGLIIIVAVYILLFYIAYKIIQKLIRYGIDYYMEQKAKYDQYNKEKKD